MELKDLFVRHYGMEPESITPLTPAGSSRRYFRLAADEITAVGCIGSSSFENEAFFYFSEVLAYCNIPRLIEVSDDRMCYLQSDLGDISLWTLISQQGESGELTQLFERVAAELVKMHIDTTGIDLTKCFPTQSMDHRAVMWDLNYFKYSFLNTTGIAYDESRLEDDFQQLAADIEAKTNSDNTLILRDCQSRNIMIKDGEPWFIDYQGARRGPRAYDLASLLWQARAGLTDGFRRRIVEAYARRAAEINPELTGERVWNEACDMAFFRSLQTLGAYGLRGRVERKPHFLKSIPLAIDNLDSLVKQGLSDKYPYLKEMLERMIVMEKSRNLLAEPEFDGLTVRVTSFSFKKGIPDDSSGNGGGFVFDCRAMDNPGRYDEYKSLTGLDKPVIDFLESRGEIARFLSSCYTLVDEAVRNYVERGFSSLMVSFGCTGGQHRSVYSAQHTAEHLHELFPGIRVILSHRERGIKEILSSKI